MKKINYLLTAIVAFGFTSSTFAASEAGVDAGTPKKNAIALLGEHGTLIGDQIDKFIAQVSDNRVEGGDMLFDSSIAKLDLNGHAVAGEVNGVPTLVYSIKDEKQAGCARGMYILAQLYSKIPGSPVAKVTAPNYFNGEDKDAGNYIWKARVCEGRDFQDGTGSVDFKEYTGHEVPCVDKSRADTAKELTAHLPASRTPGVMEKDANISCLADDDVITGSPAA